jgi:prophage regulatory protein
MLKRADGSLMAFTGMGYTTIYRLEIAGDFPARVKLSPGRVGWLRSEVEQWLTERERVLN